MHFLKENIRAIASTLGLEELPQSYIPRLETIATDYFGAKSFEDRELILSTRERQQKLDEVIAASESFEIALKALDAETWMCLDNDFQKNVDIDALALLREAAITCKNTFKSRGFPASRSRHTLVRGLMPIYEELTGKAPTRVHDPASTLDTGQFLEFVRSVFFVIDPDKRKGIEHVIRDVLALC